MDLGTGTRYVFTALHHQIRAPKNMVVVPGANHNDVFDLIGVDIAHRAARLLGHGAPP